LSTTGRNERASETSLDVGSLYRFRFRFHVDLPNATNATNATTTIVEVRWCDDASFSLLFLPPVFHPN
jgi:hypothetical protein